MNKIVFPALLVATIMVAGAFAFAPVEQASTIHSTGVLTSTSFAAGAVDTAAILDATILAADFATGAVDTAAILADTILAVDIATGGVATLEILDATILAADFAANAVDSAATLGSNTQDSPFRVITTTSAALATTSTSYTPAVATNALVTCNVLITEGGSGAISDGTLTLSITTGGGAIAGDAGVPIADIIQNKSDQVSRTWHVTGSAGTAQQYACTVGGTILASEVISNDMLVIFFPQ